MRYIIAFILGLGVCWVGHGLYSNLLDTKEADCITQIKALSIRVLDFKKACGRLPLEKEGLKVLEHPPLADCKIEPLLEKVPVDPWDREFTYLLRDKKAYLLSSNPSCGFQVIE